MRSVVIGTAGHIDHGKTALVKALTGTDTDRLKEEKVRGITIELGFAQLELGEGFRASIIDVPGHERFVKSMVAGTSGIDLVLMVVAADEGVMPQTREHLDICNLLGIERGVVALTKIDLVNDPEWIKLVREELRAELSGTFLENSPVVPVSSQTGVGIPQLVQTLKEAGSTVRARSEDALAFLGIDRAFSLHGFGTVVTGTLVSGSFEAEDSVDVLPDRTGRLRGLKIRGLQVHGLDVEKAGPGQRVAVNLSGVECAELARGQVLVHANTLEVFSDFECTLQLVPGARSIRPRTRAVFHTGTARTGATARLVDTKVLNPGERAYATIHTEEPLAALPGHRFLLRGSSPIAGRGTTLGGGRVLSILALRRRPKDLTQWLNDLKVLDQGTPGERLVALMRQAGLSRNDLADLKMRSGLGSKTINQELLRLSHERKIVKLDREPDRFVETKVFDELRAQAEELLSAFHKKNPLLPGMPSEQLRRTLARGLDQRIYRRLVDELVGSGRALQEGEVIRVSSHQVRLDAIGAKLEQSVRRIYENSALAPPRVEEVARELDRSEPEVLEMIRHLTRIGFLSHISGDMYVTSDDLAELRDRLVAYLSRQGEITTQDFKRLVGGTRKHVIPLAEYFDQEKTTMRVGEKRVLRGKNQGRVNE